MGPSRLDEELEVRLLLLLEVVTDATVDELELEVETEAAVLLLELDEETLVELDVTDCRVLLLELDSDDSPELLLLVLWLDTDVLEDVLTDCPVELDDEDRTGEDDDSEVVESDDVVTETAVLLLLDETDVLLEPLVVVRDTAEDTELELEDRFVSELDEDETETDDLLVLLLVTDATVLLLLDETDGDDWLDDDV